jgi:predicted DNA-binding protein (UPF0251 family)/predicted Fe-Mo cluster-binding NifX family protein
MPRPKQFRLLESAPAVTRFVPERSDEEEVLTVTLGLDEFEALRLADFERLSQEEAARRMKISRATFGRIIESARHTVGEALTQGYELEIAGGAFRYVRKGKLWCPRCRHSQPLLPRLRTRVVCRHCTHPLQGVEAQAQQIDHKEIDMDIRNAKVAIVTDEGTTVSSHFGRARYYEVLTFQNGEVVQRERREKFAPHAMVEEHGAAHEHHGGKHEMMLTPIRDCQVVIARGMGDGAYVHLTSDGFTTFLTDLHSIDEVVTAVASGTLRNDSRRLHHKEHAHS